MSVSNGEKEVKEKLIKNMKKEVKQIMEEAVTKKCIHEESGSITSLCGAVEACLSHGLKRRSLGLFKSSSTAALIHKVSKSFEEAANVSQRVHEIESQDPGRRSSSTGDSAARSSSSSPKLMKKHSSTSSSSSSLATPIPKYLWIRIALLQRVLAKIIDYIVTNSSKYYEKDALAADPDYGTILSSLLVGPCALDFTKMKTIDHFWTDPPADELVQRHRISSGRTPGQATPPISKRPALHDVTKGATTYRKPVSSSQSDDGSMGSFAGCLPTAMSCGNPKCLPTSAREYVESLHQNSKALLLYGKNNVHVQPKDNLDPMPGYLSLHQTSDGLSIKWTPNNLMNGCCGDSENKSVYWEYAMHIKVEEIVYVHCHQKSDSGGTIVLVGHDGIQYPPVHFPKGGHLLAFLSCLENGLLPQGHLDPPLWSQRGKGIGKVFPQLRRKARALINGTNSKTRLKRQEEQEDDKEGKKKQEEGAEAEDSRGLGVEVGGDLKQFEDEEETNDFVFRILTSAKPEKIQEYWTHWFPRVPKLSSHSSSTSSSKSLSLGDSLGDVIAPPPTPNPCTPTPAPSLDINPNEIVPLGGKGTSEISIDQEKNNDSLEIVCLTMKHQIISRAFYGWLAHCRHLRTVRTHLAGLVLPSSAFPVSDDSADWTDGLTKPTWSRLSEGGRVLCKDEIRARVYLGGVEHSIRKEVWPYLLEHIEFGSTKEERDELDHKTRQMYEGTMSEWLAVEAIVRQRDKETMARNVSKLSSESRSGETPVPTDEQLCNEVFEQDDISISSMGNTSTLNDDEDDTLEKECDGLDNPNERTKHSSCEDINTLAHIVSPDEGVSEGLDLENRDSIEIEDPEIINEEEIPDELNEDEEKETTDSCGVGLEAKSPCISPASSHGGVYTNELLESFSLNLHRIDKDVQRCDRHYWYFHKSNLEKLRNVMCTYVWEHLDMGYMQGMCDLAAPLLVVFDDESLTYACFCRLMSRMSANFPNGGTMDQHFANMRSLIQILDSEMFELMHQNGDYTHFYFCYRWFLLDFKRELVYEDVFTVWEVIWAAKYVSSAHFVLFIALALVQYYRAIILENSMDFTDVIKFFNEMAERHESKAVMNTARNLVTQLQTLIENK